uniref:C-type lectin domain-containing protein n=1 Tax=Anopheles atroparvus TaxID=41427 RepID=A0A182JMS1_ANOAO
MFVNNGSLVVVLMLACVATTFAHPGIAGEKQDVSAKEHVSHDAPQGRFLEPAFFGVRKKKFTIGTGGIGTFFRVWRNCIDEGKSLATIESDEEQRAIERLVAHQETTYWIAATNLGSSTPALTWITIDLPVKTTPLTFSPGMDTCVSVDPLGAWINNDCLEEELPYLCEEYF